LLKKNDLSYGCFVCKTQLQNKYFSTVNARMFDHLPENKNGFPSMMEFDLDNTCNLSCVMCNADNSSQIRNESKLYAPQQSVYSESLVADLKEFIPHLHQVSFAGGEPLLIKPYYKIWEAMVGINPQIRINITTNGTVLNKQIKTLIEKGFFEFSVSIDSVNKETYEKIRINGDFDVVMNNMSYLKDYCKRKDTFFGIWVCPLRLNMYEIPDLFRFFNENDTAVFLHTVWVPPGVTLWNLPSKELNNLYEFYLKQSFVINNEIHKENAQRFSDYKKLIYSWLLMAKEREKQEIEPSEEGVRAYIIVRLKSVLTDKKYSTDAQQAFIKEVDAVFAYCKDMLPYEINKQALNHLSIYPDDFVFQIFAAGTKEMICDFFKYLNR